MSAKPSLTLKRRLSASPAKVYGAWTDAAKISRWFGPENAEILHAEADVRVGGRFRIVFRGPDGEEHDVGGIYREVVPNERLVFTWAWRTTPERESLVTVALKRDGEGTLLTLMHDQFFDEAARDRHGRGWNETLDKLENYVRS
ncbi:MAG: SRPBCC family protein [Xanthobacteraceae bacterium]